MPVAVDRPPNFDTAPAPILTVRSLTSAYGKGEPALKDINLAVAPSEVLLVVGPNGAGKSTLLKSIAGLLSRKSGSILLQNNDVGGLSPKELCRAGIAFVPQENNVFASLSVQENLEVAGLLERRSLALNLSRVYARMPELAQRPQLRAGALSGGQRQLLTMGMALMVAPKLLLLDEPSAGLSPIASQRLFETIRSIREDGVAILLVEQRVQQACEIADRCLIMQEGKVDWTGSIAEFVGHDAGLVFLASILGTELEED